MTNEKISKLMIAVKSRIIEMQIEDRNNPLIDHYSNIYAIATKIVANDEVIVITFTSIGCKQPDNHVKDHGGLPSRCYSESSAKREKE